MLRLLCKLFADRIIARAQRTPYTHLDNVDGTRYMGRWWLVPYKPTPDGNKYGRTWAMRVHHIASPDSDRVMHDHPWCFFSIVLKGSYVECRPLSAEGSWSGVGAGAAEAVRGKVRRAGAAEAVRGKVRRAGSVAFRRHTDRHRISVVAPDTYTLFITGPYRHKWGFYLPSGKVPHDAYDEATIHVVQA